ncbi:Alpha/Beta hydrolase protein [Ochromonadaceae sp. CCMP2298]|nr:Alpha/Beta hydrolase protein [Ochromonadaceae sp. CCMP2298]|mmetsp:Transcript_28182/g.62405  ORF Transcript_28182/g.62405 Transcript_28182/m.62405 type:complete len:348 (-) Transcript_28182:156-1199(-)
MGKNKAQSVSAKSVEVEYKVVKKSGCVLDGVITHREDLPAVGPIIIFCHGTLSDMRHNFTDDLTNKLSNELGLRSYRFNFRFDASEFEPNHRYKFSGYEDDVDDLMAVVAALKMDGYTPWCLFGHSRGANDVLIYADRFSGGGGVGAGESKEQEDAYLHPDALAVVVAAPRFDMSNMSKTIFTPEQLAQVGEQGQSPWPTQRGELLLTAPDLLVTDSQMDMGAMVRSLPPQVPVLLLHGTEDELIPVADATLYGEQRASMQLCIVEGARHAFRGKKPLKQLLTTVTEFLGAQYSAMESRGSIAAAAELGARGGGIHLAPSAGSLASSSDAPITASSSAATLSGLGEA